MKLRKTIFAFLLISLATASPLPAELTVDTQQSDVGETTVFKMTVTPAPAPVPALKERLVLREIDEQKGNAAQFYYRAIMMQPDLQKSMRAAVGDGYDEWEEQGSDADPRSEKTRKALEMLSNSSVLSQLREAAVRRNCDWGWNLEAIEGPELYSFLLPEIQESRAISRLLAVRARKAIADGRFEDALADLRINLKMARDIATEPILVCGLVGVAEMGVGNRAVVDFIAAPNSPNLYWALTELPAPLIDLRPAVRFEMSSAFRILPFLRDAESQEHSPEEWSRLMAEGIASIEPLLAPGTAFSDFAIRSGMTGLGLVSYAPAKQRLIASGMDERKVEEMPVGKVLAVDAAREFRQLSDGMEKWWYVPYGVAVEHNHEIDSLLTGDKFSGGYGRFMAAMLLPAINSARAAEMRLQWQTDGLRTVEAIRMHAAKTGTLPNSLDEIDAVPVPKNPATSQPFRYRLEGDVGVLELPLSDGFRQGWRFEIKLAK